ncbi:MAG: hypothetical protein JO208_09745 [Alphaproteobacteria bacterium]|nr:hypothetical protein [Alphaproteobacteria bacterium]
MAITTGIAALATMKPLYDLGQQIRAANSVEKLRVHAEEALEHAINARAQTALLQDERNAAVIELAALKAEIEKAKRFDDEAENYTREGTVTGATVYREKDSAGPQGRSPYYCPNRFRDRELRIMNPARGANTRLAVFEYACTRCNMTTELPRLGPGVPQAPLPRVIQKRSPFERR